MSIETRLVLGMTVVLLVGGAWILRALKRHRDDIRSEREDREDG